MAQRTARTDKGGRTNEQASAPGRGATGSGLEQGVSLSSVGEQGIVSLSPLTLVGVAQGYEDEDEARGLGGGAGECKGSAREGGGSGGVWEGAQSGGLLLVASVALPSFTLRLDAPQAIGLLTGRGRAPGEEERETQGPVEDRTQGAAAQGCALPAKEVVEAEAAAKEVPLASVMARGIRFGLRVTQSSLQSAAGADSFQPVPRSNSNSSSYSAEAEFALRALQVSNERVPIHSPTRYSVNSKAEAAGGSDVPSWSGSGGGGGGGLVTISVATGEAIRPSDWQASDGGSAHPRALVRARFGHLDVRWSPTLVEQVLQLLTGLSVHPLGLSVHPLGPCGSPPLPAKPTPSAIPGEASPVSPTTYSGGACGRLASSQAAAETSGSTTGFNSAGAVSLALHAQMATIDLAFYEDKLVSSASADGDHSFPGTGVPLCLARATICGLRSTILIAPDGGLDVHAVVASAAVSAVAVGPDACAGKELVERLLLQPMQPHTSSSDAEGAQAEKEGQSEDVSVLPLVSIRFSTLDPPGPRRASQAGQASSANSGSANNGGGGGGGRHSSELCVELGEVLLTYFHTDMLRIANYLQRGVLGALVGGAARSVALAARSALEAERQGSSDGVWLKLSTGRAVLRVPTDFSSAEFLEADICQLSLRHCKVNAPDGLGLESRFEMDAHGLALCAYAAERTRARTLARAATSRTLSVTPAAARARVATPSNSPSAARFVILPILQQVDLRTLVSLPIVSSRPPGSAAVGAWVRADSSASDVRLSLCTDSHLLLWDVLTDNLGATAPDGEGGGEDGGPGAMGGCGEGQGGGATRRDAEATAQSVVDSVSESTCECMALSFALSGLELDVSDDLGPAARVGLDALKVKCSLNSSGGFESTLLAHGIAIVPLTPHPGPAVAKGAAAAGAQPLPFLLRTAGAEADAEVGEGEGATFASPQLPRQVCGPSPWF
ncbi:hypothetical protein T492DRAFT_848235 [Pavlovales sp. CCMP2436]|nr:hypothetical protein T492DRAFT_848235 [Pavlovales sp. CCMP2436]